MVHPVDKISDVVHISGDLGKLHRMLRIVKRFQNVFGVGSNLSHMGKAVLGVAKRYQRLVGTLDIFPDVPVLLQFLVGKHL